MPHKVIDQAFLALSLSVATWCVPAHRVAADEPAAPAPGAPGAPEQPPDVKSAVSRGLAALEKAARRYPEHRKCFSCHHQSLPLLAQVTARGSGFSIASELVHAQLDHTLASFTGRLDDLNAGHSVGGAAMTVSYGLWAVALADGKPDATTQAMVTYLLKTQRAEGHWFGQTCRPPLEESYQTCTTLAIQGLRKYAAVSQHEAADAAIAKAKAWLASAPAKSQEDKASRLWGLHIVGAEPDVLKAAREAVMATERDDGGWGQLDEMDSDAYATGQTLFLLQATGLDPAAPAYERGVQFLCKTQRADGNWLVQSRSRPFQPYYDFDDEDPLGKNQFISVPATSWAVASLAAATRAQ